LENGHAAYILEQMSGAMMVRYSKYWTKFAQPLHTL